MCSMLTSQIESQSSLRLSSLPIDCWKNICEHFAFKWIDVLALMSSLNDLEICTEPSTPCMVSEIGLFCLSLLNSQLTNVSCELIEHWWRSRLMQLVRGWLNCTCLWFAKNRSLASVLETKIDVLCWVSRHSWWRQSAPRTNEALLYFGVARNRKIPCFRMRDCSKYQPKFIFQTRWSLIRDIFDVSFNPHPHSFFSLTVCKMVHSILYTEGNLSRKAPSGKTIFPSV